MKREHLFVPIVVPTLILAAYAEQCLQIPSPQQASYQALPPFNIACQAKKNGAQAPELPLATNVRLIVDTVIVGTASLASGTAGAIETATL